jgi:5-methylcytosine-specific restriction endonuclease McrA
MGVGRAGRPWRRVVAYVLDRDGGVCQLRLTGCRLVATTADHVIPFRDRPDLELDPGNLRASCGKCNLKRGTRPAVAPVGPGPSPRWSMIRP